MLDMESYTSDGILKREKEKESTEKKGIKIQTNTHVFYELVGIVVHSGQANAGHYYSYIKNRGYVIFIGSSVTFNQASSVVVSILRFVTLLV